MSSPATKLLVRLAMAVAIASAVIAAGILDGLLPEPRASRIQSTPAGTTRTGTGDLPATAPTQLEGLDALIGRGGQQPPTQYMGVGTFADLWDSAARH
jgi:hypothetical protein